MPLTSSLSACKGSPKQPQLTRSPAHQQVQRALLQDRAEPPTTPDSQSNAVAHMTQSLAPASSSQEAGAAPEAAVAAAAATIATVVIAEAGAVADERSMLDSNIR